MRFGMWAAAAAAAAMMLVGQAQAATYTLYQVAGTGSRISGTAPNQTVYPVLPFTAMFSILATPGTADVGTNSLAYNEGNVFSFRNSQENETIDGSQSGLLRGMSASPGPFSGFSSNFSINYSDNDALGGFPTFMNTVAATGTYSFGLSSVDGVSGFLGTVSSLTVLGPTQNFVFLGAANSTSMPEPSTWLAMVLGLGAIGALLRRRRSRTYETSAACLAARAA